MGQKERAVINDRLKNLNPRTERMARINCGYGWVGKIIKKTRDTITLKNPRPFHGAPEGTPDLCGWTSVKITPDMVGQTVAVFTAEEVKATGSLSKQQRRFRCMADRMGVMYRVLHDRA